MRPGRAMTAGLGAALLFAISAVQAQAAGGAACAPHVGEVDHPGTDGSECLASSDGTGTPHANATGHSFAEADLSSGGKAKATAKDHSSSTATADSGGHSTSTTSGSNSFGEAVSDENGTSKATATGGGNGQSSAFGKCKATAKASGADTTAFAQCENPGTFATATATNGGIALGFDDKAPTCVPNGGTATVKSTFGNCP